jgi:Spy/CpxP family protein refolding chaperone
MSNMKKIVAIAFALGFLTLNSSLHAEVQLTDEQKEEALARFETLQEKLSLTDEQSPKVKEINMTYFEELSELRESESSRFKKYREFKGIDSKRDKAMKAVLSKEQYKVYSDLKKERQSFSLTSESNRSN